MCSHRTQPHARPPTQSCPPCFSNRNRRRARVQGSTLRTRTDQYKQELTADFCAWGCDRLANGTLRVEVDTVFPWSEAAAAHQHMEDNLNKGKIVLRVRDDDE